MQQHISGALTKLSVALVNGMASYTLNVVGETATAIPLSELLNHNITLRFSGLFKCENCGKVSDEKTEEGVCSACSNILARCDICNIKPELCHYNKGTCREPSWGEAECLTQHTVYLSFTSGFKVGITRQKKVPARWIDQGATMAVPLFHVNSRLNAGLVEVAFKNFIADKSHWLTMLRDHSTITAEEMMAKRESLLAEAKPIIDNLRLQYGADAIKDVDIAPTAISYPFSKLDTLVKGKAHNLEKDRELSGVLHGIKGQYLFIGDTVINIRKYAGALCELNLTPA